MSAVATVARRDGADRTAVLRRDMTPRLSFALPTDLEANEPPEARGVPRDGVRMMVARRSTGAIEHTTFSRLPELLEPGDLVVINTSGTIPAAVDAVGEDGSRFVVHLSTQLGSDRWVVEPRRPSGPTTERWSGSPPPRRSALRAGGSLVLERPYGQGGRLWEASLDVPDRALTWLAQHGRPIRYAYVDHPWPLSAYQNVYATEPGSVEMPSAGRPFTPEVITRLVAKGVGVTPLVLHAGVASLEAGELPYPEHVGVPAVTAERVTAAHRDGYRVIAVGTTVVRALESATGDDGRTHAFDGWTDLVITPERGVRAVDGLLTGWHEPEASHLMLLEAVADRPLLERSYAMSLAAGYHWHEFGDVHLILP